VENETQFSNFDFFDIFTSVLKHDTDKINLLNDVLTTLKEVLDRNNVQERSLEWDEIGAKLINGKVILPDTFENVLRELVVDNQLALLFLPEDMGGYGFTNLFAGPIIDLISQYDFSLRIASMSGIGISNLLLKYYKEPFDNALQGFADGSRIGYVAFTEPQAGSNLKNIKSTSELDGDEYILNGTKIYISNGGYGNTGLFLCNNLVNGKVEGTNVFLVEGNENITTLRLEKKSGIRVNPTAQLLFDNVRVPKENLIGEIGQGYNKVLERLQGMRIAVAFQSSGATKRVYQLAKNYAETREQFGKTIGSFNDVSRKLDSIKSQISRLEYYAYLSAYALDISNYNLPTDNLNLSKVPVNLTNIVNQSVPAGIDHNLTPYFVSNAKLYCSETCNSLMYDACQIFGGLGFISETEVNKIARDSRVLSIYDGTSEIHHWIINRSQKIIESIDKFVNPYNFIPNQTVYDKMLELKFPGIFNKI